MHQYRVKGAPGGPAAQKKAKGVRQEAAAADEDAARKAKSKKRREAPERDEEDTEQEPLMEGEVTRSQEGIEDGEVRAYAHQDIKPGILLTPPASLVTH